MTCLRTASRQPNDFQQQGSQSPIVLQLRLCIRRLRLPLFPPVAKLLPTPFGCYPELLAALCKGFLCKGFLHELFPSHFRF
jgi:hypothetical protein